LFRSLIRARARHGFILIGDRAGNGFISGTLYKQYYRMIIIGAKKQYAVITWPRLIPRLGSYIKKFLCTDSLGKVNAHEKQLY